MIKVDLNDTSLEKVRFEPVSHNMDASDGDPKARWHHCRVHNSRFEGACGVADLATIVGIFREWAQQNEAA